jgi:2-keto-4-pentenoate hydratase/2-oxohepta-3-ene-1,7-dioic acid hydratase in catechol pathway
MIFSVARIIAYWSQIGLEPGDMITTGTPSGVALARPEPEKCDLQPGDLVEAEISGINKLTHRVRAASSIRAAEPDCAPVRSGKSVLAAPV